MIVTLANGGGRSKGRGRKSIEAMAGIVMLVDTGMDIEAWRKE